MKSLESDLFTAGNQLKETLKTVNYAEELQKKLCTIKKQFLLFREAQMRIQQERTDIYTKEAKEETVEMLQKSYAEELQSKKNKKSTNFSNIFNYINNFFLFSFKKTSGKWKSTCRSV